MGEWGLPFTLNESQSSTTVTLPQVAVSSGNHAAVTWVEQTTGSSQLKAFLLDPLAAAPGDVEDVGPSSGQLSNVQLATDTLGNSQLVWTETVDDVVKLWRSRRRTQGETRSEPRLQQELRSQRSSLSLDLSASGHGILTWVHGSASNDTLGFAYFGPQTPVDE